MSVEDVKLSAAQHDVSPYIVAVADIDLYVIYTVTHKNIQCAFDGNYLANPADFLNFCVVLIVNSKFAHIAFNNVRTLPGETENNIHSPYILRPQPVVRILRPQAVMLWWRH